MYIISGNRVTKKGTCGWGEVSAVSNHLSAVSGIKAAMNIKAVVEITQSLSWYCHRMVRF